MAGGIQLAPLLTEIKVNTANFKSDMDKASSIGVSGAKRISDQMSGVTKVGENLQKVGKSLTTYVTLPIIAAGGAATKMAMDFETDFAKVSTLLDDSSTDYDAYKSDILDNSGLMKTAVGDYSDAVYQAISASVDQKDAIEFTNEAIKLAKGGFTTGANAVDILTTAINGYNMSADDTTRISDLLITTQNKGKTTVDELASSMGKVIPVAAQANFGIEELSTAYAVLTKNGIQTAEAGTHIKAMLSEITKSGSIADTTLRDLTGKGFAELKSEGMATTDILKLLSDAAEDNGMTLKDMFGSVEAGSGALVLAKEDGSEYNEILRDMEHSAGATQKAFDKMDATPAERMSGAINNIKNSAIKMGDSLVPIVEKVADKISDLADWFSNLDEGQRENVITWGLLAAGIGPVLSIVGGGLQTFVTLKSAIGGVSEAIGAAGSASGLLGGFSGLTGIAGPVALGIAGIATAAYGYHEYGQLMNRSVTESTEEMSLMERALAFLTGTEVNSRAELEAMGLVHKDFAENISPEFQKAVEDSTTELYDFQFFLNSINFDGVLDSAESEEFNYRVDTLCNRAIETINSKKEETTQSLSELFMVDDNAIDESEQLLIDYFNRNYDNSVAEVNRRKDAIYEIKQRAIDEGRELNAQELAEIQEHMQVVSQLQLEALGSTQEEIMFAKNEFAARVSTMDAESASQLLQEKASQRDEEIVQIQAGYDTKIQMLEANLEQMTAEERAAAEQEIAQLKSDKETKIQEQRDLYDSFLQIIRENNPELLSAVEEGSGMILTEEGQRNQERIANLSSTYEGLDRITESGCYQVYNKEKGYMTNLAVMIDEQTGNIVGYWDGATGKTVALTDETAQAVEAMKDRHNGAFDSIGYSIDYYADKEGQVKVASDAMAGDLDNVTDSAGGTSDHITELNNNPVNVQTNSGQAVSEINDVSSAINGIDKNPVVTFAVNAVGAAASLISRLFYNGLDYVPYDGFAATLHKGERVLTAEENKQYSSGGGNTKIDYDRMEKIMVRAVSQLSLKYDEREVARVVREVG
ncbi:MAG: phage tail tape measure protein [Clostridia bacterium]|nr:phage tail tape measure protein [Clostridia bacterium]